VGYIDDGTTPNTVVIYHDYKAAPLIFEVRGLPESSKSEKMDKYPDKNRGADIGVVIDCENGSVVIPSYTQANAYDKEGKKIKSWNGSVSHFENFFKAVRSRKSSDLNADILEGHLSSALCHTGNISYRLGSKSSPDELREKLKGNADATES